MNADPAAGSDSSREGVSRRPRRDAIANRERVLEAAAAVFGRRGYGAPLSEVAEAAHVGIGTLYRSFADRTALLRALQFRACDLLEEILDDLLDSDLSGLEAVRTFLERALQAGDRLVLPLRGAPPLLGDSGREERIVQRVAQLLERGRADGSVRASVEAFDIITFSALSSQPQLTGPVWESMTPRHIAVYVAGLGAAPVMP